jgi:methylmalonyl-CoA mutase cobalamin-binding subunit
MAASALMHAGYDVRMLGADVPAREIAPAVARHDPAVVGLTLSSPDAVAAAHAAVAAARAASPDVGILLGGAGAPAVRTGAPGVTVCTHVSDVLVLTDALIQNADWN